MRVISLGFIETEFNIPFYQKKNIKVEVYNVSKISRPSYFYLIQNQLNSNQKIITEENIQNEFEKIKNFPLVLCLIAPLKRSEIIFKVLEKKGIKYSFIEFGNLPMFIKKSFLEIFFNLLKYPFEAAKQIPRFFLEKKIEINPTSIFYSGNKNLTELRKKFSKSQLIDVPTFDYDKFIISQRENKNRFNEKTSGAVYLSSYHKHTDVLTMKRFPPDKPYTEAQYYNPITKFLKTFVSITDLDINIAQHPKQIENKNFYNYGKLHKGKTFELVKDSKFIIVQDSTAINFAVMFYKPILFITSDNFTERHIRWINLLAKYFKKKPFNVTKESFTKARYNLENKVDHKIYDKFIADYISCKKSNLTSYEIIFKNILSKHAN